MIDYNGSAASRAARLAEKLRRDRAHGSLSRSLSSHFTEPELAQMFDRVADWPQSGPEQILADAILTAWSNANRTGGTSESATAESEQAELELTAPQDPR